MRLSTSPVSRFNYNLNKIFNINKFKKERELTYLDCVLLLDIWVRISDGSSVMGNDVWDLVLAHSLSLDTAELELGFLGINFVGLVSALHIVENSKVFSSFFNANNIHDTEWESGISSNFVVNLDQSFLVLYDLDCLLTSKSISQSVSQEYSERNAFSSFVGSS